MLLIKTVAMELNILVDWWRFSKVQEFGGEMERNNMYIYIYAYTITTRVIVSIKICLETFQTCWLRLGLLLFVIALDPEDKRWQADNLCSPQDVSCFKPRPMIVLAPQKFPLLFTLGTELGILLAPHTIQRKIHCFFLIVLYLKTLRLVTFCGIRFFEVLDPSKI